MSKSVQIMGKSFRCLSKSVQVGIGKLSLKKLHNRFYSNLDKADHKRWSDLKLTLSFLWLGKEGFPVLASATSGREEVKKAAGAEECGPEQWFVEAFVNFRINLSLQVFFNWKSLCAIRKTIALFL